MLLDLCRCPDDRGDNPGVIRLRRWLSGNVLERCQSCLQLLSVLSELLCLAVKFGIRRPPRKVRMNCFGDLVGRVQRVTDCNDCLPQFRGEPNLKAYDIYIGFVPLPVACFTGQRIVVDYRQRFPQTANRRQVSCRTCLACRRVALQHTCDFPASEP